MKRGNLGKVFAEEVRQTLNKMNVWHFGFDAIGHYLGPKRPADRVVCYGGRLILLELKECRQTSFSFSRLALHQEKALEKVERAGGMGLILIKQILANRSQCFAIRIRHFLALREQGDRKSIPLPKAILSADVKSWEGLPRVCRSRRLGEIWDLDYAFYSL